LQDEAPEKDKPIQIPITGEIDLHNFAPRDIPSVVGDYLDACRAHGIHLVRFIHGRGRGIQRAVVRSLLALRSDVVDFSDAPPASGGWGSTLVQLRMDSNPDAERK
jgi:DNA-nicking Smr family endonuclease